MINFDENKMIDNGLFIYEARNQLEAIANNICQQGLSNIFFSSVGGSQAMMEPFADMINEMSPIPVYCVLSSTLVMTGHNQLNQNSLVFMSSKSGDTPETVAGAQYLKEKGCTIVSIVEKKDSPLEKLSDYSFVYEEGRPQELVLYLLIGKILNNQGFFDQYNQFADELKELPAVLVSVRKTVDDKAIEYCKNYHNEPYQIWIASGNLWPVCYSYAMCVLEESQWIRTKSVSSSEFFHGTLELIEKDVCTTLLITEGKTRSLDLRVKKFLEKYTNKLTVFDCKDFVYPHISDEFRPLLSPVVMNAILQRISKNMEVITNHSLDIRRYYRKVDY